MLRWMIVLVGCALTTATASAAPALAFKFLSPKELDSLLPQGRNTIHISTFGSDSAGYAARTNEGNVVEVHTHISHIVTVISGEGTLSYGGVVQNAKKVAEGEIRGDSIVGGKTLKLHAGDYLQIPAGMPHLLNASPKSNLNYVSVNIKD